MLEKHSVFHESYYDHSCVLVCEKDVLYTDIRGIKYLANWKRWWHNLFLLSYNDLRCRIYYVSSQAMRLERSRQFRRFRGRIHPLSKFSNFWNYFISIIIVSNRILFHNTTSVIYGEVALHFYYISVCLEIIILFDIVVSLKTGYIDFEARTVVLDSRQSLLNFASTKLFAHCVAAIPLQSIVLMRYGNNVTCVLCKSNTFVYTVRIVGALGWYRIYDSTKHWSKEGRSFKMTYFCKFLRIFVIGFITMMLFLDFNNTVNALIVNFKQKVSEDSYYAMLLKITHWLENPPTKMETVCITFSLILKSLFLFGYGLKPKVYYLDMLFGLGGAVLANIFFYWTLLECYAIVNRMTYSEDQIEVRYYRTKVHKQGTINMLRSRQLSDKISSKVMDYYHFNLSKLVVIEKVNDLYQFLPASLIKEIKLTCYTHYVKKIPYFSDWPSKVINEIVMLLKEDVYLAHDVIADAWSSGDGLFIVDTGVLAVYSSMQIETGHLIDGDYFGELSLVTDKEIGTSYVVATTRCKILFLDKNEFRKHMRAYPRMFFDMRSRLRMKYADDAASISSDSSSERNPLPKTRSSPQMITKDLRT